MPHTCIAILLLVSIFFLSHPSSATIGDPTELLSKSTSVQISPNDTWSCVPPSSTSCAFDGNSSTRWTLKPGQRTATITFGLDPGSIIDHFEVSFDASNIIPSSMAMTLTGNDVIWTTYNNRSCQASDRHLRNAGSLYYSCSPAGSFWNASVPLGLFSVRNGSSGWLWWRTFVQLQLTIEANDADYINSSIVIADIGLYGWNQPTGGCNCHPLGVANTSTPCDSNGNCQCLSGASSITQCIPVFPNNQKAHGPISGGTILYPTLIYMQSITSMRIGNDYECLLLQIDDTTIKIQTIRAQPSDLRSALPMWISWERTTGAVSCLNANVEFTYLPDPIVYSIYPRVSIVSGGITQTVIGANLDSATFPYITVYSILASTASDQVIIYNYTSGLYRKYPEDEKCLSVNSTTLKCRSMPLYGVPVGSSDYRRSIGISLDSNRYSDPKSCNVTDRKCDFNLFNDPNINTWADPMVYAVYEGRKPFQITGGGFQLGGVHIDSEYSVKVSGIVCEIAAVIDNTITFYPPDISALADRTNKQSTVLYVGAYFSYTIGYIVYHESPLDDSQKKTALIAGLVCGIGGLILLAVVIFFIVRCWRRREKEGSVDYTPRYTRPPGENDGPLTEYLSPDVKAQVDKYTVPYERIELVNELGKGYFGKVFKGTVTDKAGVKQPVAIKSLHGHHEIKDRVEFVEEAILMADFCHKNVLSLIAIVIEQNVPYVVLPLMEHGDLRNYVSINRNPFTVGQLVNFCLEVAEGMEYLASRKFVHRDLAARNCMINKDLLVKVADFGLARDIFEKDYYRAKDNQRPMPVKWMAIECLSSNTAFTEKSDVWAYGVLVWEVMTRGKRPYSDVDNLDMKRYLMEGRRLEKPTCAPEFMYDIMLRCWLPNRDDRPRFKDIVKELKEILSAAEANRDAAPSSPDGDRGMSIRVDGDRAPSYLQLSGNQQQ